jgi:hypothetical protein
LACFAAAAGAGRPLRIGLAAALELEAEVIERHLAGLRFDEVRRDSEGAGGNARRDTFRTHQRGGDGLRRIATVSHFEKPLQVEAPEHWRTPYRQAAVRRIENELDCGVARDGLSARLQPIARRRWRAAGTSAGSPSPGSSMANRRASALTGDFRVIFRRRRS